MSLVSRLEDQVLLLKIRHGDQEAFAQVYDRYVDALFRFIVFRVRTAELAQDLTSELFLRMWQLLTDSEAEPVKNLRAYLYRTARNLIADHYRTAQRTLPLDEVAEVGESETSVQLSVEHRLTLKEIEQALIGLRSDWQEVVILAYVEGMKPQEIALIIGKSSAATRVILHRAMQELKRLLQDTKH